MIYNSQYATDPILIVQGDAINFWLHFEEYVTATETWTDMDLTGYSLIMKIWNNHGVEIAEWSTGAAEIVIAVADVHFLATALAVSSCCGSFDAELYIETPKRTLWKGIIKVV
jgi:hypothetical protein